MLTKPQDCALLIAVPLESEDFIADLNSATHKEFIRGFSYKFPDLNEESLWSQYKNLVVSTVQSVIQKVKQNGVTVITNATISDFQDSLQGFSVITLVAHWRSAQFCPYDFISPVRLLYEIRHPSNVFSQTIANLIPQDLLNQNLAECSNEDHAVLSQKLAESFNEILRSKTSKLYSSPLSSEEYKISDYDQGYHEYLTRDIIDSNLCDFIMLGNRIEFFDGFHLIEEVNQAIPRNYEGILDFTVCNSVLIGNVIKRNRKCIVVVNQDSTELEVRMVLYQGIIELLTRQNINYTKAVAMIRHSILE